MIESEPKKQIFVVSDSTGETATRVTRAALNQFDQPNVAMKSFSRIRTSEEIEAVMREAQEHALVVVCTVVDPEQKELVARLSRELNVDVIDPVLPVISRLSLLMDLKPEGRPGLGMDMDEEYFRRIEAVEFAVKHDDGQMPSGLKRADIVLVGLSRTSKTPVSTYLAQKGWKVANVPVVLGIPLPKELYEIPQNRIFGLTINVASLVRIRRARLQQLNMPIDSEYGMREHIIKELKYGKDIFRKASVWPIVDVSQKAVEETASIITWMAQERFSGEEKGDPNQPDRFSGLSSVS